MNAVLYGTAFFMPRHSFPNDQPHETNYLNRPAGIAL